MKSQAEDTDTTRVIIVRLNAGTHRALRIRVAEEDTSIQKWVEDLVETELGLRPSGKGAKRVGRN